MKLKGQITFLVGQDETTIEIRDKSSSSMVCEVTLTPNQLSSALSRLAHTSCEVEVYPKAFETFGKKMETKRHTFEIPDGLTDRHDSVLKALAIKTAPEGWTPDLYFGSQDSFFTKDGKKFAGCVIRRWVAAE